MKAKLILLHVQVVFMLCFCTATDLGQKTDENVDWDYLVFTQQWPQTVCFSWQDKSTENKCDIPEKVDSWVVHGIWPSDIKGKDPQFCNSTWEFNMTQLMPLLDRLEKFWPNVHAGTSQDDFWKHEWTKHGTCAASDLLLNGEYEYFERGLELVQKFDLNKALEAVGITPSVDQAYELKDIHSAVTAHLETTSSISCYHHKKSKQYHIQEIRICLDKSMGIIECPDEAKYELQLDNFCPKDGVVYYPPLEYTTTLPADPDETTKHEL